jgi:hypothetical protein
MKSLSDQIEAFIYEFYGYGNPAGRYWLIGMEEGGGESLEEVEMRLQVWRALGEPKTADLAEFHRRLGIPQHFQDPVALQHTWAHWIRLVLAASGKSSKGDQVKVYQRDSLGRAAGETCLLELLPLPSPNTGAWYYRDWFDLSYLASRRLYKKTCLPMRLEGIRRMIAQHRPNMVICYGMSYRRWFEQIAGEPFKDNITGGFAWVEKAGSCYLLTKHPAARRVSSEYFERAGEFIRLHCRADHDDI